MKLGNEILEIRESNSIIPNSASLTLKNPQTKLEGPESQSLTEQHSIPQFLKP